MCFTKESALRGHKYRAGKAAGIAVDVAAIVIVIAVVGAEKSGVGGCWYTVCECKLSRETRASHTTRTESIKIYNEIPGYENPVTKWIRMCRALTSMYSHPPLSQSDFTVRSFPPEEAVTQHRGPN